MKTKMSLAFPLEILCFRDISIFTESISTSPQFLRQIHRRRQIQIQFPVVKSSSNNHHCRHRLQCKGGRSLHRNSVWNHRAYYNRSIQVASHPQGQGPDLTRVVSVVLLLGAILDHLVADLRWNFPKPSSKTFGEKML